MIAKKIWGAIGVGAVLAVGAIIALNTAPDDTAVDDGGQKSASAATTESPAMLDGQIVPVIMPDLEGAELMGQRAFSAKCAACHGATTGGVEGAGPPLTHKIYEPSHHADITFYRAAELGVRAHHWKFGDMPPVDGITRAEVTDIIAFIRRVQRENGID